MDEKTKYQLQSYDAIVSRLEGSCFSIKRLAVTIIAASIAFAANIKSNQSIVILSAVFLVLIFWHLDARYLSEGRRFRELKSQLVHSLNDQTEYLSTSKAPNLLNTMFSWSVVWFYGSLIALLLTIHCSLVSSA